jgi:hypothetical protein
MALAGEHEKSALASLPKNENRLAALRFARHDVEVPAGISDDSRAELDSSELEILGVRQVRELRVDADQPNRPAFEALSRELDGPVVKACDHPRALDQLRVRARGAEALGGLLAMPLGALDLKTTFAERARAEACLHGMLACELV